MFDFQADYTGLVAREDLIQCHTDRASDYYGLGVRLGIYFAWLQGYIANTMLESEIGPASDTNTIFLLTLLIAMANDSMTGALGQLDGLMLMHLCGGTIFGILSLWGYRTRLYLDHGPKAVGYFGSYGTHIRMIVSLAVSIYGLWYWVYGVTGGLVAMGPDDGLLPPNHPECATVYTFFFAKIPAAGGIRYYYIIVCASCIAYFGAMLLASSLAGWFTIGRLFGSFDKRLATSANSSPVSRPTYVTGFNINELVTIHKVLRVANLFWLIFSAIMIECTLNFNHTVLVLGGKGNNSLSLPGQLLPFLVGLFGFVRTLYSLFREKWLHKLPIPDSPTSPTSPEMVQEPEEPQQPRPYPTGRRIFGPGILRHTSQFDKQQERRSWVVRYLIAWLPWLSLLQHFDKELNYHGISREGTGFSTIAQTDAKAVAGGDEPVHESA